jgi:hypothetical protein
MRRISESGEMDKFTGGFRELHGEELHNLDSSPNTYFYGIK